MVQHKVVVRNRWPGAGARPEPAKSQRRGSVIMGREMARSIRVK